MILPKKSWLIIVDCIFSVMVSNDEWYSLVLIRSNLFCHLETTISRIYWYAFLPQILPFLSSDHSRELLRLWHPPKIPSLINLLWPWAVGPCDTEGSLWKILCTCDAHPAISSNNLYISVHYIKLKREIDEQMNRWNDKRKQSNRIKGQTRACTIGLHSASWSKGKIPLCGGLTICLPLLKLMDDMVRVCVWFRQGYFN